MIITTRMTILFITRSAAQPSILKKMLMAVAGGGAFTFGAAGTGTGVAAGRGGAARGSENREMTPRVDTCAVTLPAVALTVVGRSCQVPDFRSNDLTA